MPAPAFDTAAFLTAVRRDCFLAASDDNWTDSKILGIAHDRLINDITPIVKTCKQEWYQYDTIVTLVASVSNYELPQDAMWNGVEALFLVDTTGAKVSKLNYVSSSNRPLYEQTGGGIPTYFWENQAEIVVQPVPDSTTAGQFTMCVSSYRRPAQMVLTTQVCTVQSVTSATKTVTVASIPSYVTSNGPDPYTTATPYRMDVYGRNPPYRRKFSNLTCSPSSTSFVFGAAVTTAQVASITSGDILCVTGTTIFPDLPPDAHPFLNSLVCATILRAQTDAAGLRLFVEKEMQKLATTLRGMENRADGSPRKLSLFNSAAARTVNQPWWYWPR